MDTLHLDAPTSGFRHADVGLTYEIADLDRMEDFLVSLTGASDVWAFLTSNGGITAGRRHRDAALFPYRTDDQLVEHATSTGGFTRLWVETADGPVVWEPFGARTPDTPPARRTMSKTVLGDVVDLAETRDDLGLVARQRWQVSGRFGLVRTMRLDLLDPAGPAVAVRLTDGLLDLLPPGVTAQTQSSMSNLLNAYKLAELDDRSGLAWFRLNSRLTDRAEAAESLLATTVWQVGLEPDSHALSARGLRHRQHPLTARTQVRGEPGAYLVSAQAVVRAGEPLVWTTVADTGAGIPEVLALREALRDPQALRRELEDDLRQGHARLRHLVGVADGFQLTGDRMADAHHAASTMFNIMRGGVSAEGHLVRPADVAAFVTERDRAVGDRWRGELLALGEQLPISDLREQIAGWDDVDLRRIVGEYLPLTFSRRHGDPSRPWNAFDIVISDEQGAPRLDHQGNWRDIFQNWHALATSVPELTEQMVSVFVDATTVEGYNPYRVFRRGVEWEVPEPEDPWSNIGYWSDHQIVYLGALLETSRQQHPGRLAARMDRREHVHVDVPYLLADYPDLVADPRTTITFDRERHEVLMRRVAERGGDGRLLRHPDGSPVRATLAEKLLVLLEAKLVNFVPDGGIWMNTQRPEWNDANNALVGDGLSLVTTAQLHRYVVQLRELLAEEGALDDDPGMRSFGLAAPLATLLRSVDAVLAGEEAGPVDDRTRRAMLDELGAAGTAYRHAVRPAEQDPAHGVVDLTHDELDAHLARAQAWLAATLAGSRRDDGLVHSYNLLRLGEDTAGVRHLPLMLEGQVAALASGTLDPQQAATLSQALRTSALFRPDTGTYQLYPEPLVPGFLERNTLDPSAVSGTPLLRELLREGDRRLVVTDLHGGVHFVGSVRNAADVEGILDQLAREERWEQLVAADRERVHQVVEEVFDHASFTGRSGSMFGYEGIGSIYWHMVSKLLLAQGEQLAAARRTGAPDPVQEALRTCYEHTRSGLGPARDAEDFGAFPFDPYSHTPAGRGAQQPGMTGQAKEDVLIRLSELGLRVEDGVVRFDLGAVRESDWSTGRGVLEFVDADGEEARVEVDPGMLAYTVAGVPVRYRRAAEPSRLEVTRRDGSREVSAGTVLGVEDSRSLLARDGRVRAVTVVGSP